MKKQSFIIVCAVLLCDVVNSCEMEAVTPPHRLGSPLREISHPSAPITCRSYQVEAPSGEYSQLTLRMVLTIDSMPGGLNTIAPGRSNSIRIHTDEPCELSGDALQNELQRIRRNLEDEFSNPAAHPLPRINNQLSLLSNWQDN